MSYATKQDLVDRYGAAELTQLTDRANVPPTTIDDDVVAKAIGDAESLLDSYFGKRYQLPLASVPEIAVRHACAIARFYLWGRRAEKDGEVQRDYDIAAAWARDVARGLIELQDGGTPAAQPGGGEVRIEAPARVFSRDSLKGL